MDHNIILVTDGSSLIEKKKYESSSACSIYIDNKHICDLGVYHRNGTNSLGELYSILLGLSRLEEIINDNSELSNSEIILLSDSEYVVKSLNSYIHGWISQGFENDWKTSKGTKVSYQYIFKYIWNEYHSSGNSLSYFIGNCPIHICHMRGHIGEKVDKDYAYNKFIKNNKIDISIETFNNFIDYNHHVDDLANKIRLGKNIYYERSYDKKWLRKEKRINTRKGKIVILPRNKRNY